jgi:hypothetical protein
MAHSAPLRSSGSANRAVVVQLGRDVVRNTNDYIHPLDRVQELRRTGWDVDGLIREMRIAGYIVTKSIVKAWIRNGLLPSPPRK